MFDTNVKKINKKLAKAVVILLASGIPVASFSQADDQVDAEINIDNSFSIQIGEDYCYLLNGMTYIAEAKTCKALIPTIKDKKGLI